MLRARILLLPEAFGGSFPRPCAVRDMFFMDCKGDVPRVFQGCVLWLRARILPLFEAFAGGFPRPCAVRDMFFMDSKSNVPRVFQACVLPASSTNLAAVRGFRRRFSKAMCFLWIPKLTFGEFFRLVFCMLRARILLLFEAFAGGFPRPCAVRDMFFMHSKGDVRRVFQPCILYASGTNPAAVRGFRRRFSKAMCRERHVFYAFQR